MRIPGAWDVRMFFDGLPCLSTLSDDILVDHIFAYLMIEDILSLRQVSKLYYNLTHQGIIWKRFLQRIGPNAPPLPPSSKYSPRSLTSFEAERLVTRAITLDMNWTSSNPAASVIESFSAHRQILSMVVLPGGKYLVASVSNPARTHYALVVFVLDHRTGGVVPLAETPVKQKAYNLRAKYMTIEGVPSIAIAYVRRKISHSYKGQTNFDPSMYNPVWNNPRHRIDSPVPLQYVCTCLNVSLDALDALADPRHPPGSVEFFQFASSQPPPFRLLSVLRSSTELGLVDLAEIDGIPNMAVAKEPDTIVFKELTGRGYISTLICARQHPYSDDEHAICSFRLLPGQKQVLVIRSINQLPLDEDPIPPGAPPLAPRGPFTLAMFSLPDPGDSRSVECYPDSLTYCLVNDVEDVQINDPSVFPTRDCAGSSSILPPPINIFYRKGRGRDLCLLTIPPTSPKHLRQPSIPHYDLANCSSKGPRTFHTNGHGRAVVLPGSYRALICSAAPKDRTESPPLQALFSYSSAMTSAESDRREMLMSICRRVHEPRSKTTAKIQLSSALRGFLGEGVMAIAWDESIGRIFFAKPNDTAIHVIDIAKAPHETPSGQRWPLPLMDDRMLEL